MHFSSNFMSKLSLNWCQHRVRDIVDAFMIIFFLLVHLLFSPQESPHAREHRPPRPATHQKRRLLLGENEDPPREEPLGTQAGTCCPHNGRGGSTREPMHTCIITNTNTHREKERENKKKKNPNHSQSGFKWSVCVGTPEPHIPPWGMGTQAQMLLSSQQELVCHRSRVESSSGRLLPYPGCWLLPVSEGVDRWVFSVPCAPRDCPM